jgi:hypothetical protein
MKGRTLADQKKGSKGKVKMMDGRMVPGMMDRAGRAMAPMASPVMADRMGRAMAPQMAKKGGKMYRKGGKC